jgi:protein-S-isoprenylcysteine O-methyltransferase Ste14
MWNARQRAEISIMNPCRQALTSLGKFLAVVAVVFVLSAWSFKFLAAWMYLAVIAVMSAASILYLATYNEALLRRRLKAGPGDEADRAQRWIQTATSIAGVALMIVAGLDFRWQWSQLPWSLVIAGDIGVALAFVVVLLVFRENSFASGIVEIADDQRVVASGPYAIVRHPMYTGAILWFLCTPLALGSWWAFIPALAECLLIGVRLVFEERFLVANLPGYRDYRHTVRYRLLPGIW